MYAWQPDLQDLLLLHTLRLPVPPQAKLALCFAVLLHEHVSWRCCITLAMQYNQPLRALFHIPRQAAAMSRTQRTS